MVRIMHKWRKRILIALLLLGGGVFSILSVVWPAVGHGPSDRELETYHNSPNFDAERGTFVNRRHDEYMKMMNDFDFVKLLKEQMLGEEIRTPPQPLPTDEPDWSTWSTLDNVYIWLGHSTILFRIAGQNILFDPVFGSAAPVGFAVPRFQKPVTTLEELPPIDVVFISHDHYDHLSYEAMQFFVQQTQATFYVPLGVSFYLTGWGIESNRITEMDWWDEMTVGPMTIACTPSQHFSGRTGPRGLRTLWASWVLKTAELSVYFSGDSGYDTHFSEIGLKYGPFDIAFMETGQYNPIWHMSHMFPEESAQGGIDLRAKAVHPIHWGTFKLATHAWDDPVKRIVERAISLQLPLSIPKMGQIVTFPIQEAPRRWWEI